MPPSTDHKDFALQLSFRRLLDKLEDLTLPASKKASIQEEIDRIAFLNGITPVSYQETLSLLEQIDWVLQTMGQKGPQVDCQFDPTLALMTVTNPWPLRKTLYETLSSFDASTTLTISLTSATPSIASITVKTEDGNSHLEVEIQETISKPQAPEFKNLTALVISDDLKERRTLTNRLELLGVKTVSQFDFSGIDFCIASDDEHPVLLALETQLKHVPLLITKTNRAFGNDNRIALSYPITQLTLKDAIHQITSNVDQSDSKCILIVDDNLSNTRLLQAQLEELEHTVDVAESGQTALLAAKKKAYELVFMDLQMPDLSGEETTRLFRENQIDTPVFGLTAHASSTERRSCINAGMEDVLIKPIRANKLKSIIRHISASHRRPYRVDRQHQLPVFDQRIALENADGRPEVATEMLTLLMESLPGDMKQINDSANDVSTLKRHVHALHGALRFCGTPRLLDAVHKLEQAISSNKLSELKDAELAALILRVNGEVETLIAWYREQDVSLHEDDQSRLFR